MVETTNEYLGRILSWYEGNTEEKNYVHIWYYIPENPKQFKFGHDRIVKNLKMLFREELLDLESMICKDQIIQHIG